MEKAERYFITVLFTVQTFIITMITLVLAYGRINPMWIVLPTNIIYILLTLRLWQVYKKWESSEESEKQ